MREAIPENRFQYAGWPVVGACGVGAFFATVPLTTFGVFLQPLCDEFSWSREAASSAFGTLTLMAAASAPWLGGVLDRLGVRRVVVSCLAVSGCAVASLAALTPALGHLRIVFGVLGLVMMGASPIAYSRAIFGWFDRSRGRALGVMLAGASLSGIVLPPIAQGLIDVGGWRLAWLVLGCATLAIALPSAVRFIRERQPPSAASDVRTPEVPVAAAFRSRVFWTLVVVVFGGTVATNGALVHLVALLADQGVPASQAATSVSAMAAASLIGRVVTGWLLDRFEAARVSVVLLLIAAAGTFALAMTQSFAMGVLAAVCLGFGSGGETDVTPYLLSRHFGLRSLSTLYGFNWTAWGLAGVAGPILLGRAFDATGSYTVALVELGLITSAAAALMLTVPRAPLGTAAPRVVNEPI
jgi:MFS family permease